MIHRLPDKVGEKIPRHSVPAKRVVVDVDTRAWPVDNDVALDGRVDGEGLEVAGDLLGEHAQLVDQVALDDRVGRVPGAPGAGDETRRDATRRDETRAHTCTSTRAHRWRDVSTYATTATATRWRCW